MNTIIGPRIALYTFRTKILRFMSSVKALSWIKNLVIERLFFWFVIKKILNINYYIEVIEDPKFVGNSKKHKKVKEIKV